MAKKLKEKIATSYAETEKVLDEVLEGFEQINDVDFKIKMVIKRDGSKEKYNIKKIKRAINEAYLHTDKALPVPANLFRRFNYYLKKFSDRVENSEIGVEDIQDIVEYFLMKENPDVAKEYIVYRYNHKIAREKRTDLEEELEYKLLAKDIQNQNANVDEFSFGGRMGEANELVTKQYALDHCVSRMARENHLNNRVYIHDLGHFPVGDHNCLSLPIDDLLENGVRTRQCDIRPAGSVNTAFQLVAVYFQIQSLQQFGLTKIKITAEVKQC